MSVTPPSGEQLDIAFGDQRAVITEVGAGVRTYSVGSWEVLAGYGADEMATAGRGQVLMPWPNRLQDGVYEFGGREHQLPVNEFAGSNAIHGLVRWAPWTVREREPQRVVLETVVFPQPGYPFALEVVVQYGLSGVGLVVEATATNVGATPCPFGCGFHPYLSVGTETVDDVVLQVPAATVLRADERAIPVASDPVEGTELDFRAPRRIGAAKLDHGFMDLERDDDGLARVHVRDADSDRSASLWVDESYRYLMVFTGDLAEVGRRGLAVEPMSCPPNAFRSGEDLVVLQPRGTWAGTWGIEPR